MRTKAVMRFLAGLGRWRIIVLCLILVAALGYVDYASGAEVSFSIFYLIPIAFAAWFAGPHDAVAVAVLSGITWYAADLWAGSIYSNSLIPVWNAIVRLGFFLIVILTITRVKQALAERDELAHADPLTGVCNSRCFYQLAEQELKRSNRYDNPFSLAYIDLDDFKKINDTLGHNVGDNLLCLVAETIAVNVRTVDVLARLGGDEFVLLLPETGFAGSDTVVEKLKELLDFLMRERGWPVTLSIGLVTFIRPPDNIEEMIREADHLMYQVKNDTKDAVRHEVWGSK